MNDPPNAPGLKVSRPWPDHIEITTLTMAAPEKYVVEGFVVEMTSMELSNGGVANKIPVSMAVEKARGRWLITEYFEGY